MSIAALVVSGGVLLSRILGVVRDAIFAAMLGADGVTDQYVAAFRIPDFLNYLLAGGFLSITFIPIFARYMAADDEEGGWRALTAIIRPIAVGIGGLVVIGWIAAPWAIQALFPDFTPEQAATTTRLTRIVLPAQIAFVVGALYSAVQYAKGVFTIPTLAPIVYNLGIILGGVVYAWLSGSPDPEGFIWGAVVGAFVGNLGLQWWGAKRVGMHWVGGTSWSHPALREYLMIALPLMVGQSIVVLDEAFMSIFGNRVGPGAQTHLQYARRTMLVPVGVIAQAAGVAAYPFLARLFAEGKLREMSRTVDRALGSVIVLSLAATGLAAALTQPIVQILYQRVEFGPEDTITTARALFFYLFAIPAWGALSIMPRAFYATRDMWTPVLIGTGATVLAIPMYFILTPVFGIAGVALASTLSLGVYSAALAVTWYRRPDTRGRLGRALEPAWRAVPLAVVASGGAYAAARFATTVAGDGWGGALLAGLLGTAVFAGLALGGGTLLHRIFGSAPPLGS